METETTYHVRRFCFNYDDPDYHRIMAEGLTLDEAQEWCKRDDTHGENEHGPWFDGYEAE